MTAGIELAALAWFGISGSLLQVTTYSAGSAARNRPLVGAPGMPAYARAQLIYARHVASAQSQAHNWRLAALGSTVLCAILAIEVTIAVASNHAVQHVIDVDAHVRSQAQLSFKAP